MKLGEFILFCLLIGSLSHIECKAKENGRFQILGVGNSFTENSERYLPQIIASDPDLKADVGGAIVPACPLDEHVRLAEAAEAGEESGKAYRYMLNHEKISGNATLKEILTDRAWDYITIQQVSTKSYQINSYYPYAEELIGYIQKYAPQAEIIVHETWSHSVDSFRAKEWKLDPTYMYSQLHKAYKQIAQDFGLSMIPVGTAFQNARSLPMWSCEVHNIDVDELKYPEDKDKLPDQNHCLNRDYFWKKNKKNEWAAINDGFHAGLYGDYLGGLVWYASFFQKDPRKLVYKPSGISDEKMKSLQEIAYQTVFNGVEPNLDF